MAEYKIVHDYLFMREMFSDSLGLNYRVVQLENRKPLRHQLLCQVSPQIAGNAERWRRVKILLDGIKKSNIPFLYSPEQIVSSDNQLYLVYAYFKGKSLEQVLDYSAKLDIPISVDLAFSIVTAIADIIESGSTIVISGEKSFHGFLTPDNVMVHYDGKIYLKNYGIFPHLDKGGPLFSELESKYGAWLTPEFLRKEKTVAQSDIYQLGHLVYKMLTGKFFSQAPGEDFETRFSNLTFRQSLPYVDREYLGRLVNFFKKTLHPDPFKRFLNIKEFKDYIATYFHIEELSSVTFSLAYFMNSLFADAMEQEERLLKEELVTTLPEPAKESPLPSTPPPSAGGEAEKQPDLVNDILQGLDTQKKSRSRVWVGLLAAGVVVAVAGFLIVTQMQKTKRLEQTLHEQQALASRVQQIETDYKKKTEDLSKSFEEKLATTEAEQKTKTDEQQKLLDDLRRQRQREMDRLKVEEDKKKQEEAQRLKAEEERKKQEEEQRQKQEEEQKKLQAEQERKRLEELAKPKEGDLVALGDVTQRPVKVSGNLPAIPVVLRGKYGGMAMTVSALLLIDEKGNVNKANVLGKTPDDIRSLVSETLLKWKYTPAQKGTAKVKVWLPVQLRLVF